MVFIICGIEDTVFSVFSFKCWLWDFVRENCVLSWWTKKSVYNTWPKKYIFTPKKILFVVLQRDTIMAKQNCMSCFLNFLKFAVKKSPQISYCYNTGKHTFCKGLYLYKMRTKSNYWNFLHIYVTMSCDYEWATK